MDDLPFLSKIVFNNKFCFKDDANENLSDKRLFQEILGFRKHAYIKFRRNSF